MATIYVPEAVMVELVYLVQGRRWENVYHVKVAGGASPADLEAIADVFDTWHSDRLRALMSPAYQLVLLDLTALDSAGAPILERQITPPRGGTLNIGGQISLGTALAVKFNTGLSGRSYRGRVYHAGFGSNQLDTVTHTTPGFADLLSGYYNNLIGALDAEGYSLGIASKYSGIDADGKPIPRPVGFITPVLEATCDTRLDSMRRRLGRA